MGKAQRDEYSVNAEHFASHLVCEGLGKARSLFNVFLLLLLFFFLEERQFVLMQFPCFPLVQSFTML